MRFNERERGEVDRGRHVPKISEDIQRRGGVTLRQADDCTRVVNGVERYELVRHGSAFPFAFCGESIERCARLIWHPKASLSGREPSGNRQYESVHTCE